MAFFASHLQYDLDGTIKHDQTFERTSFAHASHFPWDPIGLAHPHADMLLDHLQGGVRTIGCLV